MRRLALSLLRWAARGKFDYKPEAPPAERAEAVKQIRARLEDAQAR